MTNEHHPFLPDPHSTCVHPLSDGRVCGGVPGQEIHQHGPTFDEWWKSDNSIKWSVDPTERRNWKELFRFTWDAAIKEHVRAEIDRLQRVEGK